MIFQKIKRFFQKKEKAINKPKTNVVEEGIVKYFNRKKGFGFIRSAQTTGDVYVHIRDLNDRVRKGDKVQFRIETNEKGLRARDVELAKT